MSLFKSRKKNDPMTLAKRIFVPAIIVTLMGLTYVSFDRIYPNKETGIPENNSAVLREKRSSPDAGIDYATIEHEVLALIEKKNYESVVDIYAKYITTDNIHAGFFNAYGVACVKLDRFEAAYYAFKRAFLLDIDDWVVLYNLISMAFKTERHSIAHGLSEIYIMVTKDNPKYLKQRKLIKEVFQSTKRKPEESNPSSKPHTLFV